MVISKYSSSAHIQTKPTLYSCEPGLLIDMNTLLRTKQGTSLEKMVLNQSNILQLDKYCTLKCSSFSVTLLFNSSTVVLMSCLESLPLTRTVVVHQVSVFQ